MSPQNNLSSQEWSIINAFFNENKTLEAEKIINFGYIVEWAKMNGVLFLIASYLRRGSTSVSQEKRIAALYEEQKLLAIKMAEIAHELKVLFEQEGIRLLPIKTFLQFPYVDDDLDIVLVDNERIAECREMLSRNGYHYLKSRSSLREPKKRFYLPRGGDKKGVRIHLHFAVSWNGVDYLDIKRVWQRRKSIKVQGYKIPIPSTEDEILIMAAHAVHENRYILLGEMLQLKFLVGEKDIDWNYIMKSAEENNWLAGLYLFLALSNKISTKISCTEVVPEWFLNELSVYSKTLRFIKNSLVSHNVFSNDAYFPIVMPFYITSLTFIDKFFSDLKKKSIKELGREFIAYTLVDWLVFWRFKKDLRRLYEIKGNA